jgi:hypothetical protein
MTDDIVALAEHCKHRYTTLRRMATGQRKYSAGERWNDSFYKLALFLRENDIDADAYLEAQMGHGTVLMPSMLCSESAKARYKSGFVCEAGEEDDSPERFKVRRERRLRYDVGYVRSRVEAGLDLEFVLSSAGSPISALTRFCSANAAGLTQVREKFRGLAKLQYATAPDHYNELYGSMLGDLDG